MAATRVVDVGRSTYKPTPGGGRLVRSQRTVVNETPGNPDIRPHPQAAELRRRATGSSKA